MMMTFLHICCATVLLNAAPQGGAARPDTIRMRVAWEVVEGEHPTADSLGELSGIALDRAGNVYVSDFSAIRIWVFDKDGRSQRAIGRKGQGPGEFEAPTGLGIGPDGRLYVRDISRVSRFALDRARGSLTRYDSAFQGPGMSDWRSKRATRFDSTGALYYPAFNTVDRTRRTGQYLRYTAAGRLVDSMEVAAFPGAPASTAHVRLNATGGRMLRGLNHVPFAPLPTWDVTPRGTLLTGDGRGYVLQETDRTGRVVRTYRRQVAPDRIPARLREDSVRALRARLDSVPVPLDRVEGMPADVRALRLPDVFPPYMAAYAGADGRVWVRRWPPGGANLTLFDVFDPDGRLRSVVVLPGQIALEPTPALSLEGVAAVGLDQETGANTIRRFVRP
jgi:hypothetical protein